MFYPLLEKQKKMFNKEKPFFLKNKRGQIGKTITWVVATVIIIMILVVSIFVATSYLGGSKKADFSKQTDILASKSFFAYLLTENTEGDTVYEQLRDEENLNDFNGNLALNIFEEFYRKEYSKVWVGIVLMPVFPEYTPNSFFGTNPGHVKSSYWGGGRIDPHITERIKLNEGPFVWGGENKYVEMTLTRPN